MSISGLARNLRVLWRADAIIAQIQLQQLLTRFGLRALATLVALFGLLCMEFAAFFALQRWDAIAAAMILGTVNFAIAVVIVLISMRARRRHEMNMANELHKSAVEALQADVANFQSDIVSFKSAFTRPLDSTLATLVVPAAGLLIKAMKKPKAAA
jgi:hypothetical protein